MDFTTSSETYYSEIVSNQPITTAQPNYINQGTFISTAEATAQIPAENCASLLSHKASTKLLPLKAIQTVLISS